MNFNVFLKSKTPSILASFLILGFSLNPIQVCADEITSITVRARFAEKTLLGAKAPEKFKAYDVAANIANSWIETRILDWRIGSNVMASAGILRGDKQNALALSVVPELLIESPNQGLVLDLGIGLAAFSRHRFGVQDFGGPFQFALTVGLQTPVYEQLNLGYRFQHYSDAGLNGPNTTGADLHMIEFIYHF
jgi:hypothetical protein